MVWSISAFLLFAAFNLLSWLLLLPYAQEQVNRHLDVGAPLGGFYFALSAVCLVFAVRFWRFRKEIACVFILSVVMCVFWGVRLHSLYCLGCADGG